jgi:hypothetical protein
LKKQAGSVRFRFYKQKTEKTEPKPKKPETKQSQTKPKSSQTGKTEPNQKNRARTRKNRENQAKSEPNRFELVFAQKTEPNLPETGRFDPISIRFWFF